MRTSQEHRDIANSAITNGTSTIQIKSVLMEKGLTNTHANDVVRNQRKKLKVWKPNKEV